MARTPLKYWLVAATIVLTTSACIFGGGDGNVGNADATDANEAGIDGAETSSDCGSPPDCTNPACHGESCTVPGPRDKNGRCCQTAGKCRRQSLWANDC